MSTTKTPLVIRPACGKCSACKRDFPCTEQPVPVRDDGHSVGCNGYGILGFDVVATPAGPRVTRYHYCRVPVRQHHTTTKES